MKGQDWTLVKIDVVIWLPQNINRIMAQQPNSTEFLFYVINIRENRTQKAQRRLKLYP